MTTDTAAVAAALHNALGHGFHGSGWDHGDGDLAHALLAALHSSGYIVVPAAEYERLRAIEVAARAARREMKARYDDLRWCNKDDDCHAKAGGAELALSDFDVVMEPALEGSDR